MDVSTLLARAGSALGKNTVYESPGRVPPLAAARFPTGGRLDCSGFVYWALQFASRPPQSRRVDHPAYAKINGGWFETSAIHADAMGAGALFRRVRPESGALLVYPDYRGPDGRLHDGHIGIVSAVDPVAMGLKRATKVIHCSLGGWLTRHDAVQETGPEPWLAHDEAIAVWSTAMAGAAPAAAPAPTLAGAAGGVAGAPPPAYRSLTPGGYFCDFDHPVSRARSLRTNNPGALNAAGWETRFPGYVGLFGGGAAGESTAIFVTPEHGIAAWHHLFTDVYGLGERGRVTLAELARRYAGVASVGVPVVKGYVGGWARHGQGLAADTVIALDDDRDVLRLARGMFGFELGARTPLADEQVTTALRLKRARALPPA